MPKRYQGNSGRFSWIGPGPSGQAAAAENARPAALPGAAQAPPAPQPPGFSLLPKLVGELETEDLILLLLCYLFYRESGDSDWLVVLGALLLS